eukprot:TRINITY_DN2122_c2_g3_i1.p1 TRINITY_DN2122_c2_g3~~TRINITY_DN2122_c2_g3_i1.p1  ORF type:complete len:413 (+),score=86.71 TRINITY_DN2122_c2_g3_i1:74-1312(+)
MSLGRQPSNGSMSQMRDAGALDTQLDSLREAVKREREKRGTQSRKWCSTTQKDSNGTTKKNSILHSRLAKTEVTKAIEKFDLFSGALNMEDLSNTSNVDSRKIKHLQDTRSKRTSEFAEIDAYSYDEENEKKKHVQRQTQPQQKKVIAAPSPPPEKRRSDDSSSTGVRMRRQQPSGNRTGGIWDAYEVSSESKVALRSYRNSTKKPTNTTPPASTPEKDRMGELQRLLLTPPAVGSNAAAHQQMQQQALTELQYLQQGGSLKSYTKGTDISNKTTTVTFSSDTKGGSLLEGEFDEAANRRSFQEALQSWRKDDTKTDPPPTSGGSLLCGTLDEESNRRAFQEAVQSWRSGGQQPQQGYSSAPPTTTAVSTEAGAPMKTPIKPLTKEFLSELNNATRTVYFTHLMECSSQGVV